jgi:Domain of unknown function (DUF222)
MADRQAVLDHLDEVMSVAALLPDDERVRVLDVAISRLQAEQGDALRALETHGGLEGSGCKTRRSWAQVYLRRKHSAHRATQRSRLLPELPLFAVAFAAGEVTDEHVDMVLRWVRPCGLEAIQVNESTLVDLARKTGPKDLEEALEHLADLVRPDRDGDKVKALGGRSFVARKVGELVHVDAMIEPALGEALKTAVESGARLPAGVKPADDGRTRTQRYADAFGEIILRGIDPQTDYNAGRLRPQISVTVSLETLIGLESTPKPLLDHFGVLPLPTVQRLICDGDLARVVLDAATGLPLDVGRNSRLAKKRQRRALQVIFKHCAFPGCTVPFRFCEIHHRDWWCRGGDTDLHLLVPYCWTHHHFLHEYGFTVARESTPDGDRLVHRRPDGAELPDPRPVVKRAVEQLTLEAASRAGPSPPAHAPPCAS